MNMSSDDFSHGILTDIVIIFLNFLLNIEGIYMLLETFITTIYLKKKIFENYRYNREDTATKIVTTHIRNINETFIGIFIDIALRYIVYYHHAHY